MNTIYSISDVPTVFKWLETFFVKVFVHKRVRDTMRVFYKRAARHNVGFFYTFIPPTRQSFLQENFSVKTIVPQIEVTQCFLLFPP